MVSRRPTSAHRDIYVVGRTFASLQPERGFTPVGDAMNGRYIAVLLATLAVLVVLSLVVNRG
jgi:hypothetical protein